ncbi:tautomerase family protein [Rhizobium puerariae]|uniref:Tautomerase family protein n=1 Tax=Rhizobium puerariae TaxID=1585791 RepID=A0ABV6ACZ3_9HYPH
MPHVIIKYFDTVLTDANKASLADVVTRTLVETLGCASGAVSIALRPVAPADWNETVFIPDIDRRSAELIKIPDYAAASTASEEAKETRHVR